MCEIDARALRAELAEYDDGEHIDLTIETVRALLDAYDELEAMKHAAPAVIVHIPADQPIPQAYHAFGNVRLYIVDESAPNDRVYEITSRSTPEMFAQIILDGETIGHQRDSRHEAIANRLLAGVEGRPRFEVIDGDA